MKNLFALALLPILVTFLRQDLAFGEGQTRWVSNPQAFTAKLCTMVVFGDASGNPYEYRPGWGEYPRPMALVRSADGSKVTLAYYVFDEKVDYLHTNSNYQLKYQHSGRDISHVGEIFVAGEDKILKTSKGEYYHITARGCGSSYEVKLDGGAIACVSNLLPSNENCPTEKRHPG